MNIFTKKLTIPRSNKTKTTDVAQTWEVRWFSWKKNSIYYESDGHLAVTASPVIEVFFTKQEAEDFAESLDKAMKLIRLNGATVTVCKSK
jgi:hypothetical protein